MSSATSSISEQAASNTTLSHPQPTTQQKKCFVARWPNDSFSLMEAKSEEEAIQILSEISDTTQCLLHETPSNGSICLDFKVERDPLQDLAEWDIWESTREIKKKNNEIRRWFHWNRRHEWMGEKVRDWVKIHLKTSSGDEQEFKMDRTLYKMLSGNEEVEFNQTIPVEDQNVSKTESTVGGATGMADAFNVKDSAANGLASAAAGKKVSSSSHFETQRSLEERMQDLLEMFLRGPQTEENANTSTATGVEIPTGNNVDDRPSRRSGRLVDPNQTTSTTGEPPAKRRRLSDGTRQKYEKLVTRYEEAHALAVLVFKGSSLCDMVRLFLMEEIRDACDDFKLMSRLHSGDDEVKHYVFEENWEHMMEFLDILETKQSSVTEWMFWNCYAHREEAKVHLHQNIERFDKEESNEAKRFVLIGDYNDGLPTYSLEADYSDPPLVSNTLLPRRKDLYDADAEQTRKVLVKDKLLFRQYLKERRQKENDRMRDEDEVKQTELPSKTA